MHELIFHKIYILLDISYYIYPVSIIILLVIIAVGFQGQKNSL